MPNKGGKIYKPGEKIKPEPIQEIEQKDRHPKAKPENFTK